MSEVTVTLDARNVDRALTLLEATKRFFEKRENEICNGYTVYFDGTECDGSCLRNDCETAMVPLEEFLASVGIESTYKKDSRVQRGTPQ